MLNTGRACAFISDLNVEPVTPHVSFAHRNKHTAIGIVKEGTEPSDSRPLIRYQDPKNDVPLTLTTDIHGTCNLVSGNLIVKSIKSNQPEYLPHYKYGTCFDGNLNIGPDDMSGVTTKLVVDDNVVGTRHATKEKFSTIPLSHVISNQHAIMAAFPPVVKRSHDLWIMSNATIMCQLCWSALMVYRPIDRGRQLQRP